MSVRGRTSDPSLSLSSSAVFTFSFLSFALKELASCGAYVISYISSYVFMIPLVDECRFRER